MAKPKVEPADECLSHMGKQNPKEGAPKPRVRQMTWSGAIEVVQDEAGVTSAEIQEKKKEQQAKIQRQEIEEVTSTTASAESIPTEK